MLVRTSRRAPPSWSSPALPLIAVVFLDVAVCAASSCRRLCRGRRARRAWKSRVTGPAGRERRCACGSLCTVPRLTASAYFEGTKSGPVRRDAGRIRAEFLGLHSDAARGLRNRSLSARRRRWGRWPLSCASGLPRTAIAPVAVALHAQLRGASAVARLRIRRARMRTTGVRASLTRARACGRAVLLPKQRPSAKCSALVRPRQRSSQGQIFQPGGQRALSRRREGGLRRQEGCSCASLQPSSARARRRPHAHALALRLCGACCGACCWPGPRHPT